MARMERWIYRDMIDVYYDMEAPFPDDLDKICNLVGARTDDERKIVAGILLYKFELGEDGYRHERCDVVIAEYHKKALIAQANGKLGGRPTKAKQKQKEPSGIPKAFDQDNLANQEPPGSEANQEPITSNQEQKDKVKSIVPAKAVTDDVDVVFAHWQRVRNYPRAKLDGKRAKAIKARLGDGYSVEDLCRAVDGIANSSHHMGQNDRRTVYDDIELICRDGPRVDGFMKLAGAARGMNPGLQSQIDTLEEWMRESE